MTKRFLLISCVFGAAAVILGAFGAHVLGKILSEADLKIYQTAVQYHFYHTFAIMGTALISRYSSKKWSNIAGWLFTFGIIFFSGSLYLMSVAYAFEFESMRPILGPITPLGGVMFIGGWMSLLFSATRYKERSKVKNKSKSTVSEAV